MQLSKAHRTYLRKIQGIWVRLECRNFDSFYTWSQDNILLFDGDFRNYKVNRLEQNVSSLVESLIDSLHSRELSDLLDYCLRPEHLIYNRMLIYRQTWLWGTSPSDDRKNIKSTYYYQINYITEFNSHDWMLECICHVPFIYGTANSRWKWKLAIEKWIIIGKVI